MILNRVKQYFISITLFYVLILQIIRNCDALSVRVSSKLQGTGFHRNLIYQMHFDHYIDDCYIAIYLQLPSAFYVNVNELIHLRRLGISTACSSGETNVELFTENAQIQNVTICTFLNDTECNMKLPLHQRYQYANENTKYINVTLPKPKLLLGCKKRIKEYRVSKIDLCSPCVEIVPKWREIPFVMEMEDVWTLPVGERSMLSVVTYVTLLLTIICTMFLIQTIWKSMPKQHLKRD